MNLNRRELLAGLAGGVLLSSVTQSVQATDVHVGTTTAPPFPIAVQGCCNDSGPRCNCAAITGTNMDRLPCPIPFKKWDVVWRRSDRDLPYERRKGFLVLHVGEPHWMTPEWVWGSIIRITPASEYYRDSSIPNSRRQLILVPFFELVHGFILSTTTPCPAP